MKDKLLICYIIAVIAVSVSGCGENRYYDKRLKMEVQRLDSDLENRWSTNGVVIIKVESDGPADKAGLEEGDLISQIVGEREVKSTGDYKDAIKKAMKKDNKAILRLAESRKIEAAVRKKGEKFGMSVDFKGGNVTVSKIKPSSPAASAGIKVGDIIQSVIDERKIKNIKDYKEAVDEIAKHNKKLTISTSELSGIKLAAIEALGNVGDKKAIKPLMEALESEDISFRRPAAKALEELSQTVPDERLIDLMIKHLQQENEFDPEVRRSGAIILGRLKAEKAIPALIDALKDPIPGVRFKAGLALSEIGSPAVDELKQRLKHGDKSEQDVAASALGDIGNEKARQALVDALNNTKESTVKLTIVNALVKIGDDKAISAIKQTQDKTIDPGLRVFIKELVAGLEHP